MDTCLNQKIDVAIPVWRKYSRAPTIPGYTQVTSLTPIIKEFLGELSDSEGQLNSDNLFGRLRDFNGSGECTVETVAKKVCKGFCKVTHILDPIHTIKHYYTHPEKGLTRSNDKMTNPMNQAYVDTLANYLLGQLRERGVSPHFCLFYGGFKAVADTYRFNITEEFGSYRRYKEFWNRKRKGEFTLFVERDDDESVESDLFKTPQSSLRSTAFSYNSDSSDSSDSVSSHESLDSKIISNRESNMVELESVCSFKTKSSDSSGSHSDSDSDSDSSVNENIYSVYSEFANYPVMMIFQERMEGVIDDMLEDDSMVGAAHGSKEWEARWIAWTFQIIAALCAAQGVLGFTHNDLHTNNIVWITTEESWLFYKNRSGTVWRIPTYGRIYKLIDFGRAIYRFQDKVFCSDSFAPSGDAYSQYNCEPFLNDSKPRLDPNPSFDLCRLGCSMYDFFADDDDASDASHVSHDPLDTLIKKWCSDDEDKNVVYKKNGQERYAGFKLYKMIARTVHAHTPKNQLTSPAFASFVHSGKNADGITINIDEIPKYKFAK